MSDISATKQSILSDLADNWSPLQIRELGSTLLRLADSIDQDWTPPSAGSIFSWPNALLKVERNAMNLAQKAKQIYGQRVMRRKHLPENVLADPCWDMLLELFMQYAGGAKVSVTSLGLAAHVPMSTALRHIALLEDAGLAKRQNSRTDGRVTFVELTDQGIVAMGQYLETC